MADTEFIYKPSVFVPFRDIAVLERVRKIQREDIAKHSNPDLHIIIIPDEDLEMVWLIDMFSRIKSAAEEGRRLVIILPNPWPQYRTLANMINRCRVDCRNLYVFAMDEYANEEGTVAPDTWKWGLVYAMKHYFYYQIDRDLRPPESQVIGFTNQNIFDYSQMIADVGGADLAYTGPGWTGHLAFFEPDAPETQASNLEEWMSYGSRLVTLSPFSIAQNSLHGSFGKSGDLAAVPPRAATIGPADIIACRFRISTHSICVNGTATSWQRFISRLALHGPVTPLVPESLHQMLRTDIWLSEAIAQNIEPDWESGY